MYPYYNKKKCFYYLTEQAYLARNIGYTHGHRCVQYDKHLQSCFQCRAAEWSSRIYHSHQREHTQSGHMSKRRTLHCWCRPECSLHCLYHIHWYLHQKKSIILLKTSGWFFFKNFEGEELGDSQFLRSLWEQNQMLWKGLLIFRKMQLISLFGTNKLPNEPNFSESGIFFFKHPLTITTSFVCIQFITFITSTIVGSVGVDTGLCTSSVCCGTFINIYKAKPNHQI